MIFADKLIDLRKKNGWSQEELAEKLNVSRQAVSKWEGAQSVPDMSRIIRLSELFGVSTDYLLKDDPEQTGPAQEKDEAGPSRGSPEDILDDLADRRGRLRRGRGHHKNVEKALIFGGTFLRPDLQIPMTGIPMLRKTGNISSGRRISALDLPAYERAAKYRCCGFRITAFNPAAPWSKSGTGTNAAPCWSKSRNRHS